MSFDASSLQSEIHSVWSEYDSAVLRDDPLAVLRFYEQWTTSDFEERDNPPGHVTNRQQMLQIMEQVASTGSMLGGVRLIETSSHIGPITLENDKTATVLVYTTAAYSQVDMQVWYGTVGEEHRFDNSGQWQQTWVKTEAGWRLQVNRRLGTSIMVDGKHFEATTRES